MVDDFHDLVEAVSCFLELNAFRVFRARNGAEGIKLAETNQPDLILMDVTMNQRTEGFSRFKFAE